MVTLFSGGFCIDTPFDDRQHGDNYDDWCGHQDYLVPAALVGQQCCDKRHESESYAKR